MKNSFIALLVAGILAVPAFTQDTSSPTSTQPAQTTTQTNTQSTTQPAPITKADTATGKDPLQPDTHEGFWGKLNPWARKKYVQRQTDPIRGRVNELDELTAANGKQIKDVDARAQQGIQLASTKANEADQHAIDATNRANAAQQSASQASTRLNSVEQVVGNIDQYTPSTQTEIRFKSGETALSKAAKDALDEMATPLKSQHGHGQAAIQNSQKMADSVVRYLVLNHDVPVYRIYLVGMGNAPREATTGDGKPKRTTGGRVEVSLLKNNLDQLAASQGQQQAPPK